MHRWLVLLITFLSGLLITITSCSLAKPSEQELIKQVQDNSSLLQSAFLIDIAITDTQAITVPVAGIPVPIGETEIIYIGHVAANAAIDVNQLQITNVQILNNQALVDLPALEILAKTDPSRSELILDTQLSPWLDLAISTALDYMCPGCTTILDLIEAGLITKNILDDGFVEDLLLKPNAQLSMGQLETQAEESALLQACQEGVIDQMRMQIEQSVGQVLTTLNDFAVIVKTLPPSICP